MLYRYKRLLVLIYYIVILLKKRFYLQFTVLFFFRKMKTASFVLLLCIIGASFAQRPFYAGMRPIGYPEMPVDALANRFGSDEPLPVQAHGDRNFVNRIREKPIDQQPFWYLNQQQYDELRRKPQTYPQRPNSFTD